MVKDKYLQKKICFDRLKAKIQHEKQKVTKGEEENSNLQLQIAKLKEGQKDLENENEK